MVFVPHPWLISLSIMLSSSIHAVAKGISSFFLSAPENILKSSTDNLIFLYLKVEFDFQRHEGTYVMFPQCNIDGTFAVTGKHVTHPQWWPPTRRINATAKPSARAPESQN